MVHAKSQTLTNPNQSQVMVNVRGNGAQMKVEK